MGTRLRTKRLELWIVFSLVASALGCAAVLFSAGRDRIPEVQAVRAIRTTLGSSVTSNGKVEPIDPQVFRARFPTYVDQLGAVEGQTVHAGQIIFTLDAADVKGQLAGARHDLLTAENELRDDRAGGAPDEVAGIAGELQRAQTDVERLTWKQDALARLADRRAATQDEVRENAAALSNAKNQVHTLQQKSQDLTSRAQLAVNSVSLAAQQARSNIQLQEDRLLSASASSKSNGILYSLPVHAGEYVQTGQVLAEVADLHKIQVRVFVDESDLWSIRLDETVLVTWATLRNKTWTGHVTQVPKQVVARGTRSVGEMLCTVDNDSLELLPNVNVDVRILVGESKGTLVIPRAAAQSHGAQHSVFLLDGGRVRKRTISVGMVTTTNYEVLGGLKEGDVVVLPGEMNLEDGMTVHATEAK